MRQMSCARTYYNYEKQCPLSGALPVGVSFDRLVANLATRSAEQHSGVKFFRRRILPTDSVTNRVTRCGAIIRRSVPPTFAATRMKRCPVLLHLVLITVALFADDVKFIAQLPTAIGFDSVVAVHADSSTPLTTIRLVDAEGSLAEVARSGRATRDAAAQPFAELQTPLNSVRSWNALSLSIPLSGSTSLVSRHTRLQI